MILNSLLASYRNSVSSAKALAKAYNFDDLSNDKQILKHHASAIKLIQNLKELCETFGGRMAQGYISNLDIILESMLCIGYSSNPTSLDLFANKLNSGAAITSLESLAAYIADHNLEKELNDEELAQILDEVDGLLSTIENASIDIEFKKMLIANLKEMVFAVRDYRLFGVSQISNMMQKTTGQTILHAQRLEYTEENKNIFDLMLSKMRDFNTIISFTSTLHHAVPLIASTVMSLPLNN